jgi:hypothetical protein
MRIAHRGFQFANLTGCMRAGIAQTGEVDAAVVGELARTVREMKIKTRHPVPPMDTINARSSAA